MKHLIAFALSACALLPLHAQDEATANGVVSIDDNRALTVRSNNGSFEFKPYLMVQTHGAFNWYDDEGLDKAYNQDNVANSGFAMPYAVLGFTGKAYDKVTYNLMRYSSSYSRYCYKILLSIFNCLSNSIWNFHSLTRSYTNVTIAVSNNY